MSLEKWLQIGNLVKHEATVAEVLKLFGLVDRELSDAAVAGLSDDGRFLHAYEAAFQLCTIALHAAGFAVGKGRGHHASTVTSLEHTLARRDTAIYLSACSTKRNHSLYDHVGVVSAEDARELLETARQLRTDVLTWLRANHAKLLPKGF